MVPLEETFTVKLAPRHGSASVVTTSTAPSPSPLPHPTSLRILNSESPSSSTMQNPAPKKLRCSSISTIRMPLTRTRFVVTACSFFLLLLLAMACFTLRIQSATGFRVRPHQALSSLYVLSFLERRQFNKTLLELAKVDLSEPEERKQINSILDGSWQRLSQVRDHFLAERLEHDDHYRDRFLERRRHPKFRENRLPTQLSSPRYAPFWPQFRSSLKNWVQNKRYDPNIMNQLVSMVKDPVDKHFLKNQNQNKTDSIEIGRKYKTCAVVGNSGILLNQSHAQYIDSHEMVIRLNNARTAGFQQFVGTKTTLSFVNSNILHTCARRNGCFCHPYGAEVPLIMYICQVVHFMDVALCGSSHQAPIIVTDPRFDTLCARIVKYYSLKRFIDSGRRLEEWSDSHEGPLFHYSSGMQAVLLAVGICDKVNIFGFGKSDKAKHHYHTSQRAELRLHDYASEYQFYMDLATRNPKLIPFLNEADFSIPPVHIYW